LEGKWTCGAQCLEAHIASVIRREGARGTSRRTHRHRIPLGLVLLSNGAITPDDLRDALALHDQTGERVGDVLRRERGVTDLQIAEALAVQWGCEVSLVASVNTTTAAVLAPRAVLSCTGMLPVRVARDGRIHVAFAHGLDTQAIFALQRIHGVVVGVGIAPVNEWDAMHRCMDKAEGVASVEVDCEDSAEMVREVMRIIRRLQPVESRLARVHDLYWLRLWLEPAALAGGPTQREDIVDVVYRVTKPTTGALA
jgi:hypothetical protein